MASLEERVSELEEKVARLIAKSRVPEDKPWWKRIQGTFKDDPVYEEAMRLGREWRESQPIAGPDQE